MTYMEYPVLWWYVLDDHKSLLFTFLVVFLDSFPMSVLFFLAGYFALPSFNKKGPALFIKDKFMRLGLPWILGVVFVAPFLARATMAALGYPAPNMLIFVTQLFLGPFYQQGPYWFLGILFFFMVLFAALSAIGKKKETNESGNKNPVLGAVLVLGLLWVVSVLTYYLSACYVKPAVEWLNVGYVLYFQPSRIIGYILMFAAGHYGRLKRWFTAEGWSPNVLGWGFFSFVSAACMLGIKFFIAPFRSGLFALVSESLTYNTVVLSMSVFLLAVFSASPKFPHNITKHFEKDSFGIYWLHMIILMPILYLLKPLNIPIAVKWLVSMPATVVIGALILRCCRLLKILK